MTLSHITYHQNMHLVSFESYNTMLSGNSKCCRDIHSNVRLIKVHRPYQNVQNFLLDDVYAQMSLSYENVLTSLFVAPKHRIMLKPLFSVICTIFACFAHTTRSIGINTFYQWVINVCFPSGAPNCWALELFGHP